MNLRSPEGFDRLEWAEQAMRVLSVHYFAPQLDLIFELDGPVYVYAGTHEICRGDSLGQALESAIGKLSDAELLAAVADTEMERT